MHQNGLNRRTKTTKTTTKTTTTKITATANNSSHINTSKPEGEEEKDDKSYSISYYWFVGFGL